MSAHWDMDVTPGVDIESSKRCTDFSKGNEGIKGLKRRIHNSDCSCFFSLLWESEHWVTQAQMELLWRLETNLPKNEGIWGMCRVEVVRWCVQQISVACNKIWVLVHFSVPHRKSKPNSGGAAACRGFLQSKSWRRHVCQWLSKFWTSNYKHHSCSELSQKSSGMQWHCYFVVRLVSSSQRTKATWHMIATYGNDRWNMLQVWVRYSPTDRTETEMFFAKKKRISCKFHDQLSPPLRHPADCGHWWNSQGSHSLGREPRSENFGGSRCHPPFFLGGGVFKCKTGETRAALWEIRSCVVFVFLLNSESKVQFSDDGGG